MAEEMWQHAALIAAELEKHVRGKYGGHYQDMTGRNFEISVPAEMAYGLWIGQEPNFERLSHGDGGFDFTRYHLANVKGTEWWRNPHLLLPEWQDIKPVRYVLVGLDVGTRRAVLCGWAHHHEIQSKPLRLWPPEMVPTRVVPPAELHPMPEMKACEEQGKLFQ